MCDTTFHPLYIVFDFDGVIADSFGAVLHISNQLADEYGFEKITPEKHAEMRHCSTREIFKDHLKISWYQIPALHKKFTQLLQHQILKVPLVAGIFSLIKELKAQGYKLAIISSNAQDNIEKFVKHHDIDHFDVIFAESSLFGKHRVINRFLKSVNLGSEDILYLGDEVRDIQACKKVNVPIAAVSWGFNAPEMLLKQEPTHLINHPSELLSILQNCTLGEK